MAYINNTFKPAPSVSPAWKSFGNQYKVNTDNQIAPKNSYSYTPSIANLTGTKVAPSMFSNGTSGVVKPSATGNATSKSSAPLTPSVAGSQGVAPASTPVNSGIGATTNVGSTPQTGTKGLLSAPTKNARGGIAKAGASKGTSTNPSSTGYAGYVGQIGEAAKASEAQRKLQQQLQNESMANKQIGENAADISKMYGDQIQQLYKAGAGAEAGWKSNPLSAVGSGNAAIAAQSVGSQIQGLAAGQQAALQGTGQQLTGQAQTQTGLNQALGSANTQQQLQLSGLGTAAGYAQPSPAAYGQSVFNPLTGQYEGNSGLPPETMAQYAQMAANGQYSAIPGSITSNPVLSAQLNAAAQQINPAYNPIASQAQGATQAANIQTLGTAGASSAAGLTQQMSQLQSSANGAEANFNLLTNIAQQGGVNNFDQPALNQIEQNVKKGLIGDDAVIQFRSIIQTVRSQYASIIGGGTPSVEALQEAQQIIPDNVSINSLKNLGVNLRADAQNRIAGIQQQISSLSSSAPGAGSQSVNNFQPVQTSAGTINTNW
jgi:hypothetical protein